MKKKTLIVGFGNEYCGDDALGPVVIKLLQEQIDQTNREIPSNVNPESSSQSPVVGHRKTKETKRSLLPTGDCRPATSVDLQTARHLDFTWAEVLADYTHLIFVDASAHRSYPLVKVKKLSRPANPAGRPFTSHHISIDHLLKITQELYGQKPLAYLVAVRGENFDFGEELSSSGRKAAERAVKKILSLLKDLAPAI